MNKKRWAVLLIAASLICQILATFQMITFQKKKEKKEDKWIFSMSNFDVVFFFK